MQRDLHSKLGFDRIAELVRERCAGPGGSALAGEMAFETSAPAILKSLEEANEFKGLLESAGSFPLQEYSDMNGSLSRIRLAGTYLDTEELGNLRADLQTAYSCITELGKDKYGKLRRLRFLGEPVPVLDGVPGSIDRVIDDKREVRDSASEKLQKLTRDLRKKRVQGERKIEQIMQLARNEGWAAKDTEVTIRDGRFLIPLPASHKRKIKGFIHDTSATGQTAYIEPVENFELNNEIREIENDIRREVIRILTALTDSIRPHIDDILTAYDYLAYLDFTRARASLAITLNAGLPEVDDRPLIHWKEAVHPLLYLSHREKKKKVVPLDIDLGPDRRILIISGPNAGGKSVCLKTAGLLQYMMQCGLLVPMDPGSKMGIFGEIFIEIGDEQSIDNDLSTYSSHLRNISHILSEAGERSLFLIDEFGAGTDPQLGGALAEACLEYLAGTQAFGVVTTHYSNLKLLAGRYEAIVNGAMLFDTNNMQPLFRMVTGKPGSSFAFEIAEKTGFPSEIIRNAAGKTGKTQLDFEKQLQELEVEKQEVSEKQRRFNAVDQMLGELMEEYESKLKVLEEAKAGILEKAKAEAAETLKNANRLIENTIRQIKEAGAEKEQTKKIRKELEEKKEELLTPRRGLQKPPVSTKKEKTGKPEKLKPGDWAVKEDQGISGKILSISGNKVTLDINGIHFKTTLDGLVRAEPPKRQSKMQGGVKLEQGLRDKASTFKLTLDLRGKKADEALEETRKFIDDAVLLSIKEISILHGKGDGILRSVIRRYLATVDEVGGFADEHIERGGSGITRVVLK